ncbi:hypothetical protein F2Q70_00035424 [Brassica cretica]|nr:hypothetical protein F2Q70_00035424 [Brassica cretica]
MKKRSFGGGSRKMRSSGGGTKTKEGLWWWSEDEEKLMWWLVSPESSSPKSPLFHHFVVGLYGLGLRAEDPIAILMCNTEFKYKQVRNRARVTGAAG